MGTTKKFARRKMQIVDIASRHINVSGASGLTLTAVARELALDTSSVTYYFKKKDQLAAACMERTVDWFSEQSVIAAAEPNTKARFRKLLELHFELMQKQRDPAVGQLALLSDLGALGDESAERMRHKLAEIARVIRHYFPTPSNQGERRHHALASTIYLGNLFWLPGWLDRYLDTDLQRACDRLWSIFETGLGVGDEWVTDIQPLVLPEEKGAPANFMRAATMLINSHGYRGASVENIAAELGVSTGSFYHHLETKDELVSACFDRSFAMIRAAQHAADKPGVSYGQQLATTIASLAMVQLTGDIPLLRTSAFQALPLELRAEMLERTNRTVRHIAGNIADGQADGSVALVDPLIASQFAFAAIHAAADIRMTAESEEAAPLIAEYICVLQHGLFSRNA